MGEPLETEFAYRIRREGFRPLLFVDYTRRAFCYPVSNVRVTLDSDLFACRFRSSLSDGAGRVPVLEPGEAILEVKCDAIMPPFIAELLADVPKVNCAISKFCKCCDILI